MRRSLNPDSLFKSNKSYHLGLNMGTSPLALALNLFFQHHNIWTKEFSHNHYNFLKLDGPCIKGALLSTNHCIYRVVIGQCNRTVGCNRIEHL